MNNPDDLHDDSQDGLDPKLQELYRQLPKEQPSPELDAKILAAAKIITANQNKKKARHWQAPFALAASVVLVSSITLYMHEENPTTFDASVPAAQAPTVEMTKSTVHNEANFNNTAKAKSLADQKSSPTKTKNAPISEPEVSPIASADVFNHYRSTALAEKKTDRDDRADQMAKTTLASKSEKLAQSSAVAKEQIARQAETEVANTAMDNFTAAAPSPAPMLAPDPIADPAPHMQVAQPRYLDADRLQDAHQANGQLSLASTESNKPVVMKKSNAESTLAAASMPAAPVSAFAGAAMPAVKQPEKQRIIQDETTVKTEAAQNISASVLSIEGVAMGMSREQLVTQGLTCYVDVCHLDLSQPQQATYWGIPTANAHLTAFLRGHVVTKLLLEQKNAQLNQVRTALSKVGIESQQSCLGEKGTLLFSRQLAADIFNVRSMDVGLSLAICQQTKALYKP